MAIKTGNIVIPSAKKEEMEGVLNYFKKHKMLLIAVDPGYDGFKIYINYKRFLSKSLVIRTGESEDFEDIKSSTVGDGTFVQIRDNSGKVIQYKTGRNAQDDLTNVSNVSADTDVFYSDAERFSTPEFRASFYSAVLRALWQYSLEENAVGFTVDDLVNDLSSWNIWMMIAVPYAYSAQAQKNIRSLLNVPIDGKFKLSRNMTLTLSGKLPIVKIYFHEQVLAAFDGQYVDPCGNYSDAFEQTMAEYLPAILIDAGYHTCAIVFITTAQDVLNGNATDASGNPIPEEVFSMEAFDKETARRLREKYSTARISDEELLPSLINDYCTGKRTLYANNTRSGGSEEVDVAAIRAAVLNDGKNRLIEYLDRKFGMKKVTSAFITGGTGGSIMFDYLSNVFGNWPNIKQVTLITGEDIDNTEAGSVFGVAYGAYKLLVGLVRADADAGKE